MQIPRVNYSPAYRAIQIGTQAKNASLLPQQQEIGLKFKQLQEDEKRAQDIQAVGDLAFQVAEGVYNIAQQAAFEKEKAAIFDRDQAAKAKVREALLNGRVEEVTTYTPDGEEIRSLQLPSDVRAFFEQSEQESSDRNKLFPKIQQWATDQVRQSESGLTDWAMGEFYKQKATARDGLFQENVDSAMQADISAGNMDATNAIAQINSASWLMPEQKQMMTQRAQSRVKVGVATNQIQSIASNEGADAAFSYLDANEGQFSEDEAAQLRQAALVTAKDTELRLSDRAHTEYTAAVKEGELPNGAIKRLTENMPASYRDAVEERLRGEQRQEGLRLGTELYDQVRDDYAGLKTTYEAIKEGVYAGQYKGIDPVHKQVLDMFERRIQEFKVSFGSAGMSKQDAELGMEMVYQSYKDGNITLNQAKNQMKALAGNASPGDYTRWLSKVQEFVPPELSPMVEAIGKNVQQTYLDYSGEKKVDSLTPEQKTEMSALQGWATGAIMDAIHESTGPERSIDKVANRLKEIDAIFTAKELEIARKGMVIKGGFFGIGGQTEEEAAAEMQMATQNADLVYVDENGNVNFAPGVADELDVLYAYQERKIKEFSGAPQLVRSFERQGTDDVTAEAIFEDPRIGTQYRYQTGPDGNLLLYARQKGGDQWLQISATPAREKPTVPTGGYQPTDRQREAAQRAAESRLNRTQGNPRSFR